jgi:hypothetical protein
MLATLRAAFGYETGTYSDPFTVSEVVKLLAKLWCHLQVFRASLADH